MLTLPRLTLASAVTALVLTACGDDLATESDGTTLGPTTPQGPSAVPPNTAPLAAAGSDQSVECATHSGSFVSLTSAGSSDTDGQIVLYEWFENGKLIATGPTPSVTLALGMHSIILRVRDDDGGTNDDLVIVRVQDTRAPTLAMNVTPTSLWPPNHTMRLVANDVAATDACDPKPTPAVTVTSNEAVNGLGDGDTAPDWSVEQDGAGLVDVWVRSERSGLGDGRVYSLSAVATDGSGNGTSAAGTVRVPHNQ
ncbi:MAG: hypothetical protein M3125_07015 [Gemmatimonadota bacterium]|nr:hypothetical protein [Gemmatimonadota bacterium]